MKIAAIVGLALLSLPAQAQVPNPQIPCRGVYLLGEKVPAGCHLARRAAVSEYLQWGDGYRTTPATPRDYRPPTEYGLYHFGGYNALYGFGH